MRTAGIICEYNPFHRGHAWQIDALRAQLGVDTAVVCAMSGNFVQRGDFAILCAHARAEAAVRGGADLVLELPLPWAISSAEGFAAGGVGVLAATGAVDTLVFGSECGDTETLRAVAAVLESDAFAALLRQRLAEGTSFAAAREAAARELLGDRAAVLAQPNDILGVEYCKAIARQNAVMEPLALARKSVGHDGGAVDGFASASHIRRLLTNGGNAAEFLTPESADIYARECAAGRAPVTMANAERAILSRLRALTEADFAACDSGGEGLYHRFYDAVQHETSIEDILAAAKSKRYAHARLRRLLLSAFLGLTAELPTRIPYLRVLACNERGREVLKTMKTTAAAPILTKSAQVRRLDAGAQRLFALTARAEEQYTLAYPSLAAAKPGSAWTTTPVIL